MRFPVAEKFKAPQGEGMYVGVPMAFIRFVGCSVGKGICHNCDTDFDRTLPDLGGGLYNQEELLTWVDNYKYVCLTGGEPLDRDLSSLTELLTRNDIRVHVESSGTKAIPEWLWSILHSHMGWFTVSPKPGYLDDVVTSADEVKVILDGLGDGDGWPSVSDAKNWAKHGSRVYIQPNNDRISINHHHMEEALNVVMSNPELRLSTQLHKYIRTR
jgi:organic radical activating enzyme